ncbi:MAG: hypothetical protein JST47_16100 [Bacteroidetes bacterium]|nr:hypothetical protein [Bacteroidota bacterium]MBS1973507.1 hypothetical protein [Bacteroidota bacterium]
MSKKRLGVLFFSASILIVRFYISYSAESSLSVKGRQGFKDLKDKLRHNAHPTDLIYNSLVYAKDKITEGIALKNIKNFNFNASKIDRCQMLFCMLVANRAGLPIGARLNTK